MATSVANRVSIETDARRAPRIRWPSSGRYVLGDRIEHHCRTIDISAGGLSLLAPTWAPIGERVVCYLDHFGRVEGRIVRLFEGGFALELTAPAVKREKLAHQIAWHTTRGPAPGAGRGDERLVPTQRRTVLHLPDRRQVVVQIVNLSLSGAAFNSPVPLTIGDGVTLGRRAGHVTRVAQRLVALTFETPIPVENFDASIVL